MIIAKMLIVLLLPIVFMTNAHSVYCFDSEKDSASSPYVSRLAQKNGKMVAQSNTFDFSYIEGRNYYLLEKGFTCRANTREKPTLKSWKNRLEFSDGEVLIWETVCNDNPTVRQFDIKDFSFSEGLSLLKYQEEEYVFYAKPPKLCPAGQWCPISKKGQNR